MRDEDLRSPFAEGCRATVPLSGDERTTPQPRQVGLRRGFIDEDRPIGYAPHPRLPLGDPSPLGLGDRLAVTGTGNQPFL